MEKHLGEKKLAEHLIGLMLIVLVLTSCTGYKLESLPQITAVVEDHDPVLVDPAEQLEILRFWQEQVDGVDQHAAPPDESDIIALSTIIQEAFVALGLVRETVPIVPEIVENGTGLLASLESGDYAGFNCLSGQLVVFRQHLTATSAPFSLAHEIAHARLPHCTILATGKGFSSSELLAIAMHADVFVEAHAQLVALEVLAYLHHTTDDPRLRQTMLDSFVEAMREISAGTAAYAIERGDISEEARRGYWTTWGLILGKDVPRGGAEKPEYYLRRMVELLMYGVLPNYLIGVARVSPDQALTVRQGEEGEEGGMVVTFPLTHTLQLISELMG